MEEREKVLLGALLHDIGKFYMRTGRPAEGYGRDEWREDHGPAGAHARWSASFFSQCVPSQWRDAGWLALTHHAPKNDPLARLVQEADHLAARFDRKRRPAEERGDISRDRLEALLEQVSIPRQGRAWASRPRAFAHALRPLALDREVVFPRTQHSEEDLRAEYGQLWDGFVREAGRLGHAHEGGSGRFDAYVTTLLSLLEQYTWCIPSATYRDYPNVPLFDHLKVTAAIASCLHTTGGAPRLLFVEGDLGGIQAFLYETAAPSQTQDGAAVRLRGKSFFLDLAMRTLAERCRADLGLAATNLLWCSGGHFAVLAPDTPAAHIALAGFRELAERWAWEEFLGDVGFALAIVPVTDADLADVGLLLVRAGQALGEAKHQRFATRLADPWTWQLPLGNDVCHGCGRDAWKETDFPAAGDEQKKCPRCRAFEAYGQRLPRTRLLALGAADPSDEGSVRFDGLSLAWRLVTGWSEVPSGSRLVLSLGGEANRDLSFFPTHVAPDTAYGFSAYSTALPTDGLRPLTFEDMAEDAEGAKFLGVLRMDVDNLGAVFALGLSPEDRSLSKLAALSRFFDWFFRGWVPVLASRSKAYVTYSGGDDLFLVGPWDRMLDLALEIQQDFDTFSCGNRDLTISGGLALVKRRFPIGRAAERAAELLDEVAKQPRRADDEEDCDKASLALFNRKVPWPILRKVKLVADDLVLPNIAQQKIRRAALHHWLRLQQQYFGREPGSQVSGSARAAWVAKLLYGITRNVPDVGVALQLQRELVSIPRWMPILVGYAALRLRRAAAGTPA